MMRAVVIALLTVAYYAASPVVAAATPGPQILECPGTNVHVWNLDQCDAFGHGGGFGGGGGGGPCGVVCGVGKVLDGLTGGIL